MAIWFPYGNIPRSVSLIVPGLNLHPGPSQDPDQLPLAHGGGDVKRRVPVVVPAGHPAPRAHQDPRHPHMAVPGSGVERGVPVLTLKDLCNWLF